MFNNQHTLSGKKRNELISKPYEAKQFWGQQTLIARQLIANNDLFAALMVYRDVFEVADILLDTDMDADRAELRYSRTAEQPKNWPTFTEEWRMIRAC